MACALPPNPAPNIQYPDTISHLTLEEKIAQMVMVRIRGDYYYSEHWYRKKLQKYLSVDGIGGVISFGGSIHGSYYNIQQFQKWSGHSYKNYIPKSLTAGVCFPRKRVP